MARWQCIVESHLLDLEVYGLFQAQWLVIRQAVNPPSCDPAELWRNVHVTVPLADIWNGPGRGVGGPLGGLTLVAAPMAWG